MPVEQYYNSFSQEKKRAEEEWQEKRKQAQAGQVDANKEVNRKLEVLREYGIITSIVEFTRHELTPLWIPGESHIETLEEHFQNVAEKWPTKEEFQEAFDEMARKAREDWWTAHLKSPQLDDLEWDTNLRIEIYRGGTQELYSHEHRLKTWVDIIYDNENYLTVEGAPASDRHGNPVPHWSFYPLHDRDSQYKQEDISTFEKALAYALVYNPKMEKPHLPRRRSDIIIK